MKPCIPNSLLKLLSFCPSTGTDPEDSLRNAFAMFDKDGKGKIPEE